MRYITFTFNSYLLTFASGHGGEFGAVTTASEAGT